MCIRDRLIAQLQGEIASIEYGKDTYRNIPFDAYYNAAEMGASANVNSPIGKVYAKASMTQARVPDINLRLKVDTLHIDRFYKDENWVNPRLSLVLEGNVKGLDIDQMEGKAVIDSLNLYDANFNFKPGKFTLEMGKRTENDKFIKLTSSLLTANIDGQYKFTSLSDEFSELMNKYLPAVFPKVKRVKKDPVSYTHLAPF